MLINKIINRLDKYFRIIKSYNLFFVYWLRNKYAKSKITRKTEDSYIVSLTTYNKRIDIVYLTIESIFNQRTSFSYSVNLYICNEDIPNGIPTKLLRLQERGLNICIVDENIRSYKKLYYCYMGNKNKNIITVDDDVFYPKWWLDKLINDHINNPHSIIAYRGHMIKFDVEGQIYPYSKLINNDKLDNKSYHTLIPTGVSGVLYPVGSLANLENTRDFFLKYAPTADDFWFKFLTLSNGYKSKLVFNKNVHFITIPDTQKDSLRNINLDGNENDVQLASLLELYPDIKRDLYEEFILLRE